ncbi:hypothetical protein [Lederbergia panacisoli]|uniref:hypothetical protein n=1 Tax=Lederbergia panacisoli TaxID=1255251 RepID=UPI00214BE844|nr:hypothetical protein [Lederbergia panacisoli]MCR2820545.1 hypothetical protein [Lederbergia panacisoli]
MPLQWIKNKWFIIVLTAFLFLVMLFSIYFLQYRPVSSQSKILHNQLKTEEKMLKVLQEKTANANKETIESSFSLQKQIPVRPLTDQLILDIEKAETVSNVFIKNMDISEGSGLLAEEVETESSLEIIEKEETESLDKQSALENITVFLSIEAKNYFDFEDFLTYLESQNRIVQVEQITVAAPTEMKTTEDGQETIQFNVSISTYYMPNLTDLSDQVPKIDSPPPANKKDPFNNFPTINREKK